MRSEPFLVPRSAMSLRGCMTGDGILLSTGDALTRLHAVDPRVGIEHVEPSAAIGRVLAANVAIDGTMLWQGRRIGPFEAAMLVAKRVTEVQVRCRLRVALLSMGDELREPGTDLTPGAIYDANRPMVAALLAGLGAEVVDLGIVPDQPATIRDVLASAADRADVILGSAGMSSGDEDHMKAAVASLGAIEIWRLAIKPGKPVGWGNVAGVPFFGLPGNPVAAFVTFLRFARPMLLRLAGAVPLEPRLFPVQTGFAIAKRSGRREWIAARLTAPTGSDLMIAHRCGTGSSAILSALVVADGFLEISEEITEVPVGGTVEFLPLSEVL